MIDTPEAIYCGENLFIGYTIAAIKQATHFAPDMQSAVLPYFEKDKRTLNCVIAGCYTALLTPHNRKTMISFWATRQR